MGSRAHGGRTARKSTTFAREVNADVIDAEMAEILSGFEASGYHAMSPAMARPMRLPSARPPGRAIGCGLSALAFCAAMAGIAYFCAQGVAAAGPFNLWLVKGPFVVLDLSWEDILASAGMALACGAVACFAFLAGSARTGLIAERRHPLIPSHSKRGRKRAR